MKSKEEVLKEFLDYARSLKPNANWNPHSPLSDLVIAIPSHETWKLWIVADYVRRIQTFQGVQSILLDGAFVDSLAEALGRTSTEISQLLDSDLDALAADWGFARKEAQFAFGTVRVYYASSGTYSMPEGTVFSTSSGLMYKTLHEVTSWETEILDGKPAIDVAVRCTTSGTIGNIGPHQITGSVSVLAGSTGATNPYGMAGGADREASTDFVARILNWLGSTSVGTVTWLQNLIFQQEQVRQVRIVTCRDGDPEKFARGYGADIWVVVAEEPVLATEVLGSTETIHYALQQPVIEGLSIPVIPSGWSFSRFYPVNYITGEKNVYALSIFGSDIFTGETPAPGNMNYYYDRAIERLQMFISKTDYWFLGGESLVVVRKALPRRVNLVNADIWLTNGYQEDEVKAAILNDLGVFFAGGMTQAGRRYSMLELGKPVDHSDIVEVILEVEGVDRVSLETFAVELEATDYDFASTEDPLPIRFFEYPVLGTVNLTFHTT